ncbi:MAG: iron dependent repressor, metal binding and dimerization domain protein [bacterium]
MMARHRRGQRRRREQEMLEAVWTAREDGSSKITEITARAGVEDPDAVLGSLAAQGLVTLEDGQAALTEAGEREAREIIRRHRLAEILLHQVMALEEDSVETEACEFEHSLNPEVVDSICTLLGHPRTCQHGKPIPSARCCEKFKTEVQPIVQRLSDLKVGQSGSITLIAPKFHSRLDRLGSLGIAPGAEIRLHQKFPAFVVEIGQTTVAVDRDIADEIFVRLTPRGE